MWESMTKKVSHVGQDVLQKTRNMSDVSSLKSRVEEEKRAAARLYGQLGRVFFARCGESLPKDEELSELCRRITRTEETIDEYNRQIMEIRNVKLCPVCSAEMEKEALFCPDCGARVETPDSDTKICPVCGAPTRKGTRFCSQCGARIDADEKTE